jgi:acyl-coenzyme A thioesterase PaaI-like protein
MTEPSTFNAERLRQLLLERLPTDVPLRIPPPCLLEMQAGPIAFEEGQSLTIRFPVFDRYRNPLGHVQGGFLAAALDNTIGPFSYLIAPPSVTMQLNISYLRPIDASQLSISCIARLTARTRRQLHIAGEVRDSSGKVAVLAQSVSQLL